MLFLPAVAEVASGLIIVDVGWSIHIPCIVSALVHETKYYVQGWSMHMFATHLSLHKDKGVIPERSDLLTTSVICSCDKFSTKISTSCTLFCLIARNTGVRSVPVSGIKGSAP